MTEVPRPDLLDPERLARNDRDTLPIAGDLRSEAEALRHALRDSCEYATQLWERLDAVRDYLVRTLPPVVRFTDEGRWDEWITTYATVMATLEGPRGDSGFSLDEARRLADSRREFPSGSAPTPETIVSDSETSRSS